MKGKLSRIGFVMLSFVLFTAAFLSCTAEVSSDAAPIGSTKGSISVDYSKNLFKSREVYVQVIDKADITVIGQGMTSVSKNDVEVSSSQSSAVIENITAGRNRVVTVQAKRTIKSILDKMDGVALKAVVDVKADAVNHVTVDWASTPLGNIIEKLISDGYDVSILDEEKLQKIKDKIPSDTPLLADIGKICDFVRNATEYPSYKMNPGTVEFKTNTAVTGAAAWLNDPVSEKTLNLTGSDQTISNIAPGTWEFYIVDESGTVLHSEKITVKEGESVKANSGKPIVIKVPSPRLEDSSGKSITEFISANTTVYLSLRTFDDETPLSGGTIYYTTDETDPLTSSTRKEYSAAGIPVNVGTKLKAVGVASGFYHSDIVSWTFAVPKIGEMHPSKGLYSQVEQSTWTTATYPLGAKVDAGNTTFALYSKNATKILLEIYDAPYGKDAKYDYWLTKNTGDDIWRAKLSGDLTGKYYAFRCWGENWTFSESWKRGNSEAGFVKDYDDKGNRFNPNKVVFDPYAKELSHDKRNASALGTEHNDGMYGTGEEMYKGVKRRNFDTGKYVPKAVIVNDSTSFGTKPEIPQKDAIIYEAHVRGLTMHPSSARLSSILSGIDGFSSVPDVPAEYRGTYKGAAYMAKYLKALGVNTVEFLPVHEADNDGNPDNKAGGNYWAYMTYGYFSPDRRYAHDKSPGGPTKEFKEMVKSFHDEGIEVYLDVVFNHTGEGGPWFGKGENEHSGDNYKTCEVLFMRGIDNSTYYCLTSDGSATNACYWETTGCGNNMQCDNSTVRNLIVDSLKYWIDEMGVDGFRYDLAPVLGRVKGGTGWSFSSDAQTLTDIASLGESKNVEMIAEAWDTSSSDGYQVGKFPSKWGEWNGRFRDALRNYVGKGDRNEKNINDFINGDYANFNDQGGPHKSVNFIVAHDGYTLADLCSGYTPAGSSYNGDSTKLQWPFGPSDGGDSSVPGYLFGNNPENKRQANRNYTAIQMMSRGVPLIVWGDEFNRTQNGNNNPYNVDSVATWNNYGMINTKSPHLCSTEDASGGSMAYHNNFGTFNNIENRNGNFMFMKYMMNLRATEPCLRQDNYDKVTYTFKKENGTSDLSNTGKCVWIKIEGSKVQDGHDYLMFMNMHTDPVQYTVPAPAAGYRWTRIVDTALFAESNFNCWSDSDKSCEYKAAGGNYGVNPWSVVIFKQVKVEAQKPACASPTISGTTPFDSSTTVTIAPGASGATVYYTTDGNEPTTSSAVYNAPFTVEKNTTVKAICTLAGHENSPVVRKSFLKKAQTLTENSSGVMLQGFTWNSAPRGAGFNAEHPSPNWYKWYKVVKERANDIKNTFEYVWCPPPSKCDSSSSEGYAPTQLNDLNSFYGSKEDLTAMISAISPAKAIADIVVNHRAGTTSWGDFTNPSWCDNYYAICSDDEGFSSTNSPMFGHSKKGAQDSGEKYSAYRDLDHTNVSVQQGIIDWMNNVLIPAGFVGWRYDFVKGFGAKYVGKYNAGTSAAFSVGEYWPTNGYNPSSPDSWGNEIKNWVSNTETEGGKRSKAFDFALKGAMNNVFGCTWFESNGSSNGSAASNNYALLADNSNLYISQPEDAVTFVDNHDTGSNQGHWALTSDKVGAAYALILTHPGFPCVSWSHYFTFAESGSNESTYQHSHLTASSSYMGDKNVPGTTNTLRQHIDKLIELRKSLGIEYNSERTTKQATSSGYAAEVTGTNGSLIVLIGNSYTPTDSGYTPEYEGTDFKIWKKAGSGTPKCRTPKIEITDGKATITCGTKDATIMYGFSTSTITNTYTTPVTMTSGQTIYAKASHAGMEDSAVASKEYDTSVKVTLSCTSDAGWGRAVFFCGSFTEANNWTKAVRGTCSSTGNIWTVTVKVPASGNFEWKPTKGQYDLGELTNQSSVSEWYPGTDNLKYPNTTSVNW